MQAYVDLVKRLQAGLSRTAELKHAVYRRAASCSLRNPMTLFQVTQ